MDICEFCLSCSINCFYLQYKLLFVIKHAGSLLNVDFKILNNYLKNKQATFKFLLSLWLYLLANTIVGLKQKSKT